ncbi:MAG: hypothetical protein JKP92_05735 [Alphaproteobacteria bacterium]|nr:hypothetical protein [Alphaproteobacteria bacterium]
MGVTWDAAAEMMGLMGAGLYLVTYAIIQHRRDFVKTLGYSLMNLVAAGLVLFSLCFAWNGPSAFIQVSWICISLFGLARCLTYDRKPLIDASQIGPDKDKA